MRYASMVLAMCVVPVLLMTAVSDGLADGLSQGTVEIAVYNSFNHASYSYEGDHFASLTEWDMSVGVGKCVTNIVEIGGGLGLRHQGVDSDYSGSESMTAVGPRGFVILNFPSQGRIVPYLEGAVGARFFSGDGYDDAKTAIVLPSLGGGFRVLVGDSASLNFGLTYQHVISAEGMEDVSANEFLLGVGVSLLR